MNRITRMLCASALLPLSLWVAPFAGANPAYPSKPIRLIAPFAPGGSTDTLARIIGPALSKRLGQPVVIENRPGAGGNLGIDAVAKAEPDGYTIGIASPGPMVVNVTLQASLPYDPIKDLAPVALIADLPIVLVVNKSVAANDVAGLIAADKANPGKLFFASAGTGTTMHLSGELLNVMAGTRLQHVPYKGTGAAMTDLLSNQVQVGFLDLPSVRAHVTSGALKLLAVGNPKRAASAPNVQTISEAGVPGYETSGWFGVVAPGRTPPEIIRRIHEELSAVMAQADVQARLMQAGIEPTMSTPEEFGKFVRSEIPKWAKVIQISGAKGK